MKSKIIMIFALVFMPVLVQAESDLSLEAAVGNVNLTTATTSSSTLSVVTPEDFCARVATVGEVVRTEAALKAADHRADIDRLALARDEEKRKLTLQRASQRGKEDSARDALLSILRERAESEEQVSAVDAFGVSSARLLLNLRAQSDRARESYAKVTRHDALIERATRDRALDGYIERLDKANLKVKGECLKGAKSADVLASYNTLLVGAKVGLAKDLQIKKTSLEHRAKEAHHAELSRLDREYREEMQHALTKLIEVFPSFFDSLVATGTPQVISPR